MNSIAHNMIPTDDQLRCEHVIGYFANDVGIICGILHYKAMLNLFAFPVMFKFCPKCGARLEG